MSIYHPHINFDVGIVFSGESVIILAIFLHIDLNGKISEEYDIVPEFWKDEVVNLNTKDYLTHIQVTYHKGET